MGDYFDVHIEGTKELAQVLATYESKALGIGDQGPVIAEMLVAAVSDVFEAEGPGWEDLAESTQRARRGSSYKILQDTGTMAGSIGPDWGEDWAAAKGGVDYVLPHVTGSLQSDVLPQRNPFDLGPYEEPLLDEVTELLLSAVTS